MQYGAGSGKYRVIALTNNFSVASTESIPQSEIEFLGWQEGVVPPRLRELFDDFCDSSEFGTRYGSIPPVASHNNKIFGKENLNTSFMKWHWKGTASSPQKPCSWTTLECASWICTITSIILKNFTTEI
jgi:hypothetical protein